MFSAYVFLTAGPMFYESLQANLSDSLPAISTVERYISESAVPVREGEFRFKELLDFLVAREFELKVWLSEDGTRIKAIFQYDFKTNQIVGPVLPLSESNGAPILNSFPATSAAMIAKHFIHGAPASSAYAIMAQPVCQGAPSFCLCLFGTNNSFTAEDVSRRWDYIVKELSCLGIEVLGFAADGDPKVLKAMRARAFPPNPIVPEGFEDWYFSDLKTSETMIQDTIHVLNRFKTRLLKPSVILPMGNCVASASHLKILINDVGKAEHGLTDYDLTKKDKMNFNATVKICSERVSLSLEKNVVSCNATLVYLDIMRKIQRSFLETALTPLQRIYNMWYCMFFLRLWKYWLKCSKDYTMANFITMNMFIGCEINTHGIVKVVRRLRETGDFGLFLIWLFSSQTSEAFFRKARSMTTTESTVINFSMLEFCYKTRRIDFLSEVATRMEFFDLPREKRKKFLDAPTTKMLTEPLPSDASIKEMIVKAFSDAKGTAAKLGMKFPRTLIASDILCTDLGAELDLNDEFYDEEELGEESDQQNRDRSEIDSEDDIPLDILAAFPSDTPASLNLLSPDIANDCDAHVDATPLPVTSKFVRFYSERGRLVCMRKTTLCWLLRTEGTSISNDRLLRVKADVLKSLKKSGASPARTVQHCEEVSVGDFCVFDYRPNKVRLLGQILAFSYLSGKQRSYSLDKAPTKPPRSNARGMGCLCSFFQLGNDGQLVKAKLKHDFLDIKHYLYSVPPPEISESGILSIKDNVKALLKN